MFPLNWKAIILHSSSEDIWLINRVKSFF